MSTGYFYSDPLAAAWMARHHGMDIRLHDPEGEVFLEAILLHGLDEWRRAIAASAEIKFYIHPDSLHLLEAQIGDLALCEVEDPTHEAAEFQIVNYDPRAFDIRHGIFRIIQRSGVPFFWPQSEGA